MNQSNGDDDGKASKKSIESRFKWGFYWWNRFRNRVSREVIFPREIFHGGRDFSRKLSQSGLLATWMLDEYWGTSHRAPGSNPLLRVPLIPLPVPATIPPFHSHQTRIYPRNCCAPARFWSSLSISQATRRAHRGENRTTWAIDRDRDHTRTLKRSCCGSVKLNAIKYRSFRPLELLLMKLKAILLLKRIN